MNILLAINLPYEIKKELGKFQEKYKEVPVIWQKPQDLRIVLSSLGKISKENLNNAASEIKSAIKNIKPFKIDLNAIDFFPFFTRDGNAIPQFILAKGENENLFNISKALKPFGAINSKPRLVLAKIKKLEFSKLDAEEIPVIKEDISIAFDVKFIDIIEIKRKKHEFEYSLIKSISLN